MHLLLGVLFSLSQVLSYPFPNALSSSNDGKSIAYVLNERGVRSIWFAQAPGFTPRMLWTSGTDDGQEISDVSISNDGTYVVYVRGGDHDANWPERPWPDPDLRNTQEAHMQVISLSTSGGQPKVIADGDAPAISPDNARVAFVHDGDGKVWIAPLDGSKEAAQYFFDRGNDSDLTWSSDGEALAFTSDRGDHAFIGVYRDDKTPLVFLAPSTSRDFSPQWSPDGKQLAFVRIDGDGGPPQDPLKQYPLPWTIMVADARSGSGHEAWNSGDTLRDSLPEIHGPQLRWVAGNRLAFISERTNWPHLYVVSASGSHAAARLLTPGNFMIEDTAVSPDLRTLYYTADTGNLPGDDDRRHIFRVPVDGGAPVQVTHGTTSEWWPAATADGIAYVQAGARAPTTIVHNGTALDADRVPKDFPANSMVTPKEVTFRSRDGLLIHGQLFTPANASGKHPGVIFVHGGPPRQMLLTWHYFDYYSYAYATNQYLANHGFVVLSVNYRLGIGYGHDFHNPPHAGPAGAAEYQDVVAGARYLQRDPNVDPKRIGIWGGSYGGYLTAMGLAKNSDIFKAGSDMHGVHDWSMFPEWFGSQTKRYQQPGMHRFMRTAWLSSPDAYISTWRSPVLLLQGDDDRNVHFHQMVDLVDRLKLAHVPFEQIVIPNEIHGFLRWHSWYEADQATADFLTRKLKP
ncbi:MAG TPA: prolyl oligopeptidase family serine peptidase [Candidatus Baltobacteraceae bacterium]|nr:prolyl oligopeptidase family serine peptidase [Candidatus Baltobacteraceae bacterium]